MIHTYHRGTPPSPIPPLLHALLPQTSRLRNSQDATVTEMRAKSERTAARLRAETQAFATEKVRYESCYSYR